MNVVITGANRGIGLELVRLYCARGCSVIALCRESSPALAATGARVVESIDVATAEVGGAVASALDGEPVDLLVNNAGLLRDEQLGSIDYSSIEQQIHINTLGPLRVTEALLPNFKKGSKIALITSRMGSITDNTSGGRYGYRMSKAALNAVGMSLARDLQPQGVAVAILHPGFVQTEMVGGNGDIPPSVAAERLVARIDGLNLENSGTFWHSNGEVLPW